MGRITNALKNRRVMIAIGFVLLIVLIFVVSALGLVKLSLTERILCAILVVFLWLLLFMYERMQEVRRSVSLEQAIHQQADVQLCSVKPGKRPEIEQFQKELNLAIESLKRSKIGRGRSGKAALYALPWYLMIGPPGGGKTTAIKNSGLDFPTGIDQNKELRGVGGTRNCEWFFSTSAILLDTAGRYVSEEEDQEEWLAFLDMLKKHRRKKPINGVLVGFSMQDLLNAGAEELKAHAQKIRRRIDELMQRLGIHFPVYLVFTKCDLLDGFMDFFGDLNRREREQIWGCTFTPEQIKAANPAAVFAQEFQLLLDSLTDLRMARLHSPLKREQRRKVFLFPLQLAAAKERLVDFAGQLFQANPYHDNPSFRGFYFTSGTQEGVPLDSAVEAISREFGLPPMIADNAGFTAEIKHYFIKDLFTQVVIPDQNFLVGETSRAAEAKQLARLGIMVGSVLALGLFILGVSLDYRDSKNKMDNMAKASQVVQSVKWPGEWGSNFSLLEQFRSRMEHYDDEGPLSFGMSRRGTMLDATRGLYFKKMKDFTEKYLYTELQRRLQGYNAYAGISSDQGYNYLKAYLLMGDEVDRLNETEWDFLRSELMGLLAVRFTQKDSSSNGSAQDLQTSVNRQIQFFVENLGQKRVPAFKNDANLVNRVRDLLIVPVTAQTVYSKGIKRQGLAKMPGAFSAASALGSGASGLFGKDQPVPNLFTQAGWEKFAKEAIVQESQDPGREDWVLGNKQRQLSDEVKNPELLAEKLRGFYFNEYIRVWQQFLQSLQYETFPDLRTAGERLKTLSDAGNSPLKVLLEKVSAEVSFDEALKSIIGGGAKKIGVEFAKHPVDRAFVGLHTFIGGGSDSPLTTVLGQLAGASGEIEELAGDPTGIKAKDYAAKVVQSESGELPKALKEIRKILNKQDVPSQQVLKNLFDKPLQSAWGTVLGSAYGYLNSQWQSQVYEPYESTLQKNYPFNRRGPDAGLDDVANFFGPDGTFWKFAQAELQPFFRRDNYSAPLAWEGRGIGLSGAAQEAFRDAKQITTALAQSGVQVKFAVRMQRPQDDKIDEIQLLVGGRPETYEVKKNPPPRDFDWPGPQPTSGAALKVVNKKGILGRDVLAEQKVEGLWGWFRLVEQWNPSRRSNAEYECAWKVKKDNKEYLLKCSLVSRSAVNPFAPGFFNFRCPSQLN